MIAAPPTLLKIQSLSSTDFSPACVSPFISQFFPLNLECSDEIIDTFPLKVEISVRTLQLRGGPLNCKFRGGPLPLLEYKLHRPTGLRVQFFPAK